VSLGGGDVDVAVCGCRASMGARMHACTFMRACYKTVTRAAPHASAQSPWGSGSGSIRTAAGRQTASGPLSRPCTAVNCSGQRPFGLTR